jgi:hypothetical protein
MWNTTSTGQTAGAATAEPHTAHATITDTTERSARAAEGSAHSRTTGTGAITEQLVARARATSTG